jgi:predicted transcriptional regulator
VLLNRRTLDGIAAGTITLLFRRWLTQRVKPGSSFRTHLGVVGVDAIEEVSEGSVTARQAREAGYVSRGALLEDLSKYPDGRLFRIAVRLSGADPRVALRRKGELTDAEVEQLAQKLAAMGVKSNDGPWAMPILRAIEQRPGVLAARLARSVGMDVALFKPRVRQLKELGLTESLETGYRLSPRGEALMRRISKASTSR